MLVAGLSALVLSNCGEYERTNEVVGKDSFEIPKECDKVIGLSYDSYYGWVLLCNTAEKKEIFYNRFNNKTPWRHSEIVRK